MSEDSAPNPATGEARATRGQFGRMFEDFAVGDVYVHRPGRTITETDNIWFSLLTMNQNPLHVDAAYNESTEFGQPLVNSCLTLSILVGLSVNDVSYNAVANLGWNDVRLIAPVFAGDTIYASSEVIAKRASTSRPGQGIVTVRTTGSKADGTPFMSFERSVLIPERSAGAAEHSAAAAQRSADAT